MRVYLGLGGNVGDRAGHLAAARAALSRLGILIQRESRLYETEPAGFRNQSWFLNQALRAETSKSPVELLLLAKEIESAGGRRPSPRNGPRTIDVDILIMEGVILRTEALTVPHPRLAERRFVLVPLAEIAPRLVHPILGKTVTALLRECPDRSIVRRFAGVKTRP